MKFKTIYIDPPWRFRDLLDPSRRKPYPTLSFDEIKKLPIKDLAEKESHLYLWVPSKFLELGLILIKEWEFKYICPIIWEKFTKKGKKWFGIGHYSRHSFEICLFGVKNKLKLKTRNTRNSFDAKKPNDHHASKPEEMYEIIEKNSHDPYLEIFATKNRKGWISIGNEIDGKDIRESIGELL